MPEEKVVWVYWNEHYGVHLCEHYMDSNGNDIILIDREESCTFDELMASVKRCGGRISTCTDCFKNIEIEQWAVIVRDTGEVMTSGSQTIDPDRVRFLVLAEHAEREKDLRGKPNG
jgi:hypothetical protein